MTESNENYNSDSIYDELSSIYDEEYSSADNSLSSPENDEQSSEIIYDDDSSELSEDYSGLDSWSDSSDVYTSSNENADTEIDTISDSHFSDENSAVCSSVLSDNDYLYGIYQNTTYNVVFEFVLILLLIITLFSRFLIKIIM